jgi:hypothetical protein
MATFKGELAFGKVYERVAAEQYAALTWPGAIVAPCNTFADIDFIVVDPAKGLVGFVEIKTRKIASTKYDSTIVSMRKHEAGRYGQHYFKVPTMCVVVFTDNAGVFDLKLTPDLVAPITRWDRDKPVPHAHYNHDKLVWMPNLFAAVMQAVADEQGLDSAEPQVLLEG